MYSAASSGGMPVEETSLGELPSVLFQLDTRGGNFGDCKSRSGGKKEESFSMQLD